MITPADMKRYKLDAESLKARFDRPHEELNDAEKNLLDRWRARAQNGWDFNFDHYQHYLALERAWDANFYQSTQTLVGFLQDLSSTEGMDQVVTVAKKWKMTHLLTQDVDPKTGQPTGKQTVNVPVIYSVILSLGRAYTMARVSRLVNERLGIPFMKFEPAVSTAPNKVVGEFITQGVGVISREFRHEDDFKQGVQGAGKYGQQLMFIREEWYRKYDYNQGPVLGKEGQRYVFPHPFRTYYDISYPLRTLNSDTGCRYIGYWDLVPFQSIRLDPYLWNRDRIKMSTKSIDPAYQIFLQNSGGCRISAAPAFPHPYTGSLDPINAQENNYYTRQQDNYPVWITEHYEKVNPKRDFGDDSMPDEEFWFRVRLASDNVPVYVSCLPDRPGVAWLWEPDDQRMIQEGMLLQVIPFQDMLTNLITQANLTAKQNLANLNVVNTDAIAWEDFRKDVINPGELNLRKTNYVAASFRALDKMGVKGPGDLLIPIPFPKQGISELVAMMGQLLALLERVTGMSAQEVGSYASHEQSAEELRLLHSATSQRFEYIASWIDGAFEAWKSMLYSYWCAYGSVDVVARADGGYQEVARQLGFTQQADGTFSVPPARLRLNSFIAQRDGPNRIPQAQLGTQMTQLMTTLIPVLQGNPVEMVRLLNESFEALGLPRTFRLTPPEQATPDMQTWVVGELEKMAGAIKEYVDHRSKTGVDIGAEPGSIAGVEA